MAGPFLDTSALVKRYVAETGTHWVIGLTDLTARNDCWLTSITPVELLAALYLRVRTGSLTLAMAQHAEQKFRQELSTHFHILSLIPVILNQAMGLVTAHPLRAYDAVQLAAALYLDSQSANLGLPSVIMVSADHNLNQAAIAEGLAVDDPNQQPCKSNGGRIPLTREVRMSQSNLLVILLPLIFISACRAKAPYEGKGPAELERMLRDPNPAVQAQGAYGLSRLGPEARPAVPSLIAALKKDSFVRQNAALALGQIGPDARDAVPALSEALSDSEWAVRRQAALALGLIGSEARKAIPMLRKLSRDPDQLVRKAAQDALKKIRGAEHEDEKR